MFDISSLFNGSGQGLLGMFGDNAVGNMGSELGNPFAGAGSTGLLGGLFSKKPQDIGVNTQTGMKDSWVNPDTNQIVSPQSLQAGASLAPMPQQPQQPNPMLTMGLMNQFGKQEQPQQQAAPAPMMMPRVQPAQIKNPMMAQAPQVGRGRFGLGTYSPYMRG